MLRAVLLIFCITLCLCLTPAALAEGETGVIIPNGTTIIEDEAFAGCANITSVTIPASVARIGAGAFAGCNGLKEVHFNGSASQWDAVYVNSNNAPLRNSMICFQNGQCRIPLDERYFSDAVFRGYVAGSFDSDGDGWLNEGEVVNVKHILCPDMGISSLKGVELFAELRTLNCPGNNLSELDISHNTKLKDLCCGVSYSDGTMYGEPHGNHLASLDVSNNPDLETLYCAYNNLTSLNLRSNTKLKELLCYSNQISSLDVSRNTALTRLLPGDNPLGSLNVRANTNLEQLNCYDNGLTNLDLSQNRNLVFLWCNDNRLTSLNLSNHMKLDILRCDNNNLTSLNLSGCSALRQVFSSRNSITNLNLSGCTALEILECQQNSLSSLDVNNCTNLRYLMLWRSGSYTSLDLSRNSALFRVNLSANNNLSNLTLGSMQNLEMLWVQNTNLRSLNISGCPTILAAYIQGTKTDFGRYGAQIDNGDWYGYQLGEGLNPGSSDPVSLCQFCVDKRVNLETHVQNDIQINSRNFPDDAFRGYVAENFDCDVDGWLDAEEISAVKEIRCYRMGISSLKGLEFFKATPHRK